MSEIAFPQLNEAEGLAGFANSICPLDGGSAAGKGSSKLTAVMGIDVGLVSVMVSSDVDPGAIVGGTNSLLTSTAFGLFKLMVKPPVEKSAL